MISNFWPLGEGFLGFRPQIRLQHAEISQGTNSEVIWLELKRFPKFGPVAFQYPESRNGRSDASDYHRLDTVAVLTAFLANQNAMMIFEFD